MMSQPDSSLPNALLGNDGAPVRTAAQWPARRHEIRNTLLALAYGALPPAPLQVSGVELHSAAVRHLQGAWLKSIRVKVDGQHAFVLRVWVPPGSGPFPVLLHGDGCWDYATTEVTAAVLRRGYVFAQFNRVELASDLAGAGAVQSFNPVLGGAPCAALAAWAWGYHRAVDALLQLDGTDPGRIAIVGHSRGGKSALLAGATDERIALTSANNSGAGGAGSFRVQGPGAETLVDVVGAFPHWFAPQLAQYSGREHELPFDQHFLKALIAPRALLTTEALGDQWANPWGTWRTHLAAREVYALLGVPERIAIAFREGGHEHNMADWSTLLDFCDTVFRCAPRAAMLDVNPFPHLPAALARGAASRSVA